MEYINDLIRFSEKWAAEKEATYDKKPKQPIQYAIDIINIFRQNDIHIYYDRAFYIYTNGCYRYIPHEEMLRIINPIICTICDTGVYTSASKKRKILDELRHFQYPLIPEPEKYFINFKTYAYDLLNRKKLPERRHIFFKYCLPFDKGEDFVNVPVKCPKFMRFINDVIEKEYVQFIINYIYSLFFTNIKFEIVPFFFGSGSNGKSTLIELIIELVGRDNCSFCSIDDLINKNNSEYYISQIEGKLLNVCADNSTSIDDEGKLKSLISKEPIMARNPYEGVRAIKDIPSFIFSFNKLPYLSDYSHGMLRKIIVVPFNKTFKQDSRLIHELKKELPEIFRYIISNADHDLIMSGKLTKDDLYSRTKIYLSLSDSVTLFLCYLTKTISDAINIKDMYDQYKSFCYDYGYNRCNYDTFKERLKKNGIVLNNRYINVYDIDKFKKMVRKLNLLDTEAITDVYGNLISDEEKEDGIYSSNEEIDI